MINHLLLLEVINMSSLGIKTPLKMSIIQKRLKKDKKKTLRQEALKQHQESQAFKNQEWIKEFEIAQQTPERLKVFESCKVAIDKARLVQVGGDHYRTMKVQPWDAIHSSLDTPAFLAYLRGTAIAYLMRCQDLYQEKGKQSIEDTEKAIHTLQKYMEVAKEWLSAKP